MIFGYRTSGLIAPEDDRDGPPPLPHSFTRLFTPSAASSAPAFEAIELPRLSASGFPVDGLPPPHHPPGLPSARALDPSLASEATPFAAAGIGGQRVAPAKVSTLQPPRQRLKSVDHRKAWAAKNQRGRS